MIAHLLSPSYLSDNHYSFFIAPVRQASRNVLYTPLGYVWLCAAQEEIYPISPQGVLLNTKKEFRMVYDCSEVDTYFQYTTVSCSSLPEVDSQSE